jgi:hypothetical protein
MVNGRVMSTGLRWSVGYSVAKLQRPSFESWPKAIVAKMCIIYNQNADLSSEMLTNFSNICARSALCFVGPLVCFC